MDLAGQLIFLIIFGLVGFAIGYFTGFNPANLYSNVGTIVVLIPLIIIAFKATINPERALEGIEDLVKWFVDVLPGALIGDIAGSIVGSIVGGNHN